MFDAKINFWFALIIFTLSQWCNIRRCIFFRSHTKSKLNMNFSSIRRRIACFFEWIQNWKCMTKEESDFKSFFNKILTTLVNFGFRFFLSYQPKMWWTTSNTLYIFADSIAKHKTKLKLDGIFLCLLINGNVLRSKCWNNENINRKLMKTAK